MIYVDTHAHLYENVYKDRLDSVLARAYKNNVKIIMCVSEDIETALKSLRLSKKYDRFVYPLIGIHPWTASHRDIDLNKFSDILEENLDIIIGIGEIGLDRKYTEEDDLWKRQVEIFQFMLKTAEKFNLPVQVHSRNSAADVLDIIMTHRLKKVQFHWYSDTESILKKIVDNGFYVSFTPSITYSKRIKKLARLTPIDLILSETDSPVSFYGKFSNRLTEPSFVIDVVRIISELHHVDVSEIRNIILNNVQMLYELNIRPL